MATWSTKRSRWLAPFLILLLSAFPTVADAKQVPRSVGEESAEQTLALLKRQPSLVRSRDNSQCTPLHRAASRGQVAVVRWLLAHNAEVNAKAYNGFTPLHLTKRGDVARLLLKHGADPSIRDSWGKTPLQNAAQMGHTHVANAIIEAGHPIDLASALMLGKRDLAKKIIREQPDTLKGDRKASPFGEGADLWGNTTPLGIAAGQGDKEMVLLLLEAGAPVDGGTFMPNAGGVATPLYNAVRAGHVEVVEILCKAGANCNVIGGKFYRSLLDFAQKHSDKKIVDLLVKHGAKQIADPFAEPDAKR
jgi:ankyrin repeat protein